ncbi:MAG: hypothetical protein AAGH38_09860, partial [Pseudomonadota bacterium]
LLQRPFVEGNALRFCAPFVFLIAASAVSGCSTTIDSFALAEAPPAKPQSSLPKMGTDEGSLQFEPVADEFLGIRLTTENVAPDLAQRYVTSLKAESSEPIASLNNDVDTSISSASALIERAEELLGSRPATMQDVSIVEDAIQNARLQRAVFLESLRLLSAEETPADLIGLKVSDLTIRARFDAAILTLGKLATDLSRVVMDQRLAEAGIDPNEYRQADIRPGLPSK